MRLQANRLFGGTALSAAEARKINEYIGLLEKANALRAEIIATQRESIESLEQQRDSDRGAR